MVEIKVCRECSTASREHLFKQDSCKVCGGELESVDVPRTGLFYVQLAFLVLSVVFIAMTLFMLIQYRDRNILEGRWFEVAGVFSIAFSFGLFAIGFQIKESRDMEERASHMLEPTEGRATGMKSSLKGSGMVRPVAPVYTDSRELSRRVRLPRQKSEKLALPPKKDGKVPTRYPRGLNGDDEGNEWADDTIISIPPTRGKSLAEVKPRKIHIHDDGGKHRARKVIHR